LETPYKCEIVSVRKLGSLHEDSEEWLDSETHL
jgi:hypothetical protein